MNDTKPKTVFEERDNLRRENERLLAAFESKTLECVELRNQLAAAEEALAQTQRESAELREKFEAARKVADAAVEYQQFSGSVRDHIQFGAVLFAAVRNYREVAEGSK